MKMPASNRSPHTLIVSVLSIARINVKYIFPGYKLLMRNGLHPILQINQYTFLRFTLQLEN